MIWLIAKKDFLLNLVSPRFVIGFILCLVIIPFTLIVSVDNYLNQVRIYKIEQAKAQEELKEARVYSAVRPTVVKEPIPLSIFSNGITPNTGNKTKIYMMNNPVFLEGHVSTRDNPLLNSFYSIDFSMVIAILISLLALVFSYDAITRERENGTMKLVFTGRVSRIAFLTGKITGLLITLLPILLFCYLLACLIILINPQISFSGSDWGGIIILFLTSVIYMIFFILLGLLISSFSKQSSVSIVLSLLCWIWCLFLVPNIAVYLSQSMVKHPSYENVKSSISEYEKQYYISINEQSTKTKQDLGLKGLSYYNYNGGEDGYVELSGGLKEMTQYHQRMNTYRGPAMIDLSTRIWPLQKKYIDDLEKEQKVQQYISWLSPSEIFTQATDKLCGTSSSSYLNYMSKIREYREMVIQYFNEKNLFSLYRYFTIQPENEFPTKQEWDDIRSGKLQSNLNEAWSLFDNYQPLDLEDLPLFINPETKISDVINAALGRISALLGLSLLVFIFTIALFLRYDIR